MFRVRFASVAGSQSQACATEERLNAVVSKSGIDVLNLILMGCAISAFLLEMERAGRIEEEVSICALSDPLGAAGNLCAGRPAFDETVDQNVRIWGTLCCCAVKGWMRSQKCGWRAREFGRQDVERALLSEATQSEDGEGLWTERERDDVVGGNVPGFRES